MQSTILVAAAGVLALAVLGLHTKVPFVDRVIGRVNLRVQHDVFEKKVQGRGIADQRRAIVVGLRDSVDEFRESVPGRSAG